MTPAATYRFGREIITADTTANAAAGSPVQIERHQSIVDAEDHPRPEPSIRGEGRTDTTSLTPVVVRRPKPGRTAQAEQTPGREGIPADTTVITPRQGDSLSRAVFEPDSAQTASDTPVRWREATAGEVFGDAAQSLTAPRPFIQPARPATDYPSFDLFVLLLSVLYASLLYNKAADIRLLLLGAPHATTGSKRLAASQRGGFSFFINTIVCTGILISGVAIARIAEPLIPQWFDGVRPRFAALAAAFAASAIVAAIVLFQRSVLWLAGEVTLMRPFVLQLRQIKSTYFALLILALSPAALFIAICPGNLYVLWFCIIAAGSAIAFIIYLTEALRLFISKKISILLWFLYLCTVEVFPISLLWLLAVR